MNWFPHIDRSILLVAGMALKTAPGPLKSAPAVRQTDTSAGVRLFDCRQHTLEIGRARVTQIIDVKCRSAGDMFIEQRILICQFELLEKSICHQIGTESFEVKTYASCIASQML